MSSLRYFSGIQYGDFQNLEVLVDPTDNSLWITQPSMALMLGWATNDVRKKITSKSLKAFAGKALAGAKKVTGMEGCKQCLHPWRKPVYGSDLGTGNLSATR